MAELYLQQYTDEDCDIEGDAFKEVKKWFNKAAKRGHLEARQLFNALAEESIRTEDKRFCQIK